MITGYNIQNFDLPYLISRAQTLKVREAGTSWVFLLPPGVLILGRWLLQSPRGTLPHSSWSQKCVAADRRHLEKPALHTISVAAIGARPSLEFTVEG